MEERYGCHRNLNCKAELSPQGFSVAVQRDKKGVARWRVRTEEGNSLSPGTLQ